MPLKKKLLQYVKLILDTFPFFELQVCLEGVFGFGCSLITD